MKKIFATVALCAMALNAGAQTMYDAITFSTNHYYGTARTIGMGNAVAAVGGDLGSIGINPAGSAVAGYSQFVFTPGLGWSSNHSEFTNAPEAAGARTTSADQTVFRPNVTDFGLTVDFQTGAHSGLCAVTFGFVGNMTNNFLDSTLGLGSNDRTSMLGSFAAGAEGIPYTGINSSSAYKNGIYPWNSIMAYNSNMIATMPGMSSSYIGATEVIEPSGDISLAGPLSQRSNTETFGTKTDLILNLGLNFSNSFYLGFNIGIPTMKYSYNEYFREAAQDKAGFPTKFTGTDGTETTMAFQQAEYNYNYVTDVDGIYAKVGAIYRTSFGLRMGLAIQTPTAYIISESWRLNGVTTYDKRSFSSDSGLGEYTYSLRSPYIFNAGLAYTIGSFGLISVDYELADYSVMRYSDQYSDTYNDPNFYKVNTINGLFCGAAHQLRVGGELKLNPLFAVRAGYTFASSPEKYYYDTEGYVVTASEYELFFEEFQDGRLCLAESYKVPDCTQSFSIGGGYSSNGSFFADLAARVTMYPTSYFSPYADYITGVNAVRSPELAKNRNLFDVVLTVGWRF